MASKLKSGDRVTWNSTQGQVRGKVVKKVTGTTQVKGHTAKASTSNPEYVVKSDKTGAKAVHKPGQLKKA